MVTGIWLSAITCLTLGTPQQGAHMRKTYKELVVEAVRLGFNNWALLLQYARLYDMANYGTLSGAVIALRKEKVLEKYYVPSEHGGRTPHFRLLVA